MPTSDPRPVAETASTPETVPVRILQQARAHFFTHGYSKFTMDDLATELGMSKKTLYVHFAGKDEILSAVIDEIGREVRAEADAQVRAAYEASLLALKPRFELYKRANFVNRHPWLADLLIWRANNSARLVKRMSGVLNETSNPGHLVTVKGLVRLFTE